MARFTALLPLAAALLAAPLAAAAAPHRQGATTLTLSVTGSARHLPDAMAATLEIAGEAPDAAAAQDRLNRAMAAALHAADGVAGVRATTGSYFVTPTDAKRTAWIARQELNLACDAAPGAPAAAGLRGLIGQLQHAGARLQSLDGRLSAATAAATRERAIGDAVRRLRAEAQAVARSLGETVGTIRTVQVDGPPVRPVFGGLMVAGRAAPPVARPAAIEERVSLSATIELVPAAK
ncbi:SIMPL domain-containing protein [Acidiphilium multivorum]|uniref:SIMPL domain-containing protein n=1 Tax=Acidiphilium multivorum TaxID=62140 RepID=UPI0039C9B466